MSFQEKADFIAEHDCRRAANSSSRTQDNNGNDDATNNNPPTTVHVQTTETTNNTSNRGNNQGTNQPGTMIRNMMSNASQRTGANDELTIDGTVYRRANVSYRITNRERGDNAHGALVDGGDTGGL